MDKVKARPASKARVRVVRQHPIRSNDNPREQMHAWVSTRLREVWDGHFTDTYAVDSAGVELGMQVILYLTNSPHISTETLVKRLAQTYPDLNDTLESNAYALAEAFRGKVS